MTEPKIVLDNLTGEQIQKSLDYLIQNALKPIIENSKVFDAQVVHLLGMVTKNKKRKISALPREEFTNILCRYLVSSSPEKKLEFITVAKIERGFIYNFVSNTLVCLKDFLSIYHEWLLTKDSVDKLRLEKKLNVLANSVGSDILGAYLIATQSKDYLALVYDFRNSIVDNYKHYAYKQAKAFCSSKTDNFDFQDVWHNFLTSITKAVDKYDCSKGALTSYLKWWILNAQNTNSDHGHEYGIAYSIPQLQKQVLSESKDKSFVNFGVSLSTIVEPEYKDILCNYTYSSNFEDHFDEEEENSITHYLIKEADLDGLARLYLDLPEYFSNKEKRKMLKIMKQQGIKL